MINILACSGGIYKTFKESYFIHFSLDSKDAEVLLKKDYTSSEFNYKPLQDRYHNLAIVQMIISGNNTVIAEVIDEDIFKKYFEEESGLCEKESEKEN